MFNVPTLIYVLTTSKSIRKVYICMVLKLLLHKNNRHFVDSYNCICYCLLGHAQQYFPYYHHLLRNYALNLN